MGGTTVVLKQNGVIHQDVCLVGFNRSAFIMFFLALATAGTTVREINVSNVEVFFNKL